MQAINRWRNWTPADKKFGDPLPDELTELTKPHSVSFVSAIPGHPQNFLGSVEVQSEPSPRPETLAQVELLPAEVAAWDDAMHKWTQARCAWRERSWGSVSGLYISHIEHAHQTGGMFAPDRETFIAILMALEFVIEDAMVYGLILAEDEHAGAISDQYAQGASTRERIEVLSHPKSGLQGARIGQFMEQSTRNAHTREGGMRDE